MELFALLLCFTGFVSLSSAFKLVVHKNYPIELQNPAKFEYYQDLGSILPSDNNDNEDDTVEPSITSQSDTVSISLVLGHSWWDKNAGILE